MSESLSDRRVSLVSYTVPCHKRTRDLLATLPSVLAAAAAAPPVELVLVDYGNPECLGSLVAPLLEHRDVTVRVPSVSQSYFHMAHARNVGLRVATGDLVVAFLADQFVSPDFFSVIRRRMTAGVFLKWHETFVFNRSEILDAGGFDERFEFYGPEGKELTDRLQRRGLRVRSIPRRVVSQIPTPDPEKIRHYREPLSKRAMHQHGMRIWEANRTAGVTVANEGQAWGLYA